MKKNAKKAKHGLGRHTYEKNVINKGLAIEGLNSKVQRQSFDLTLRKIEDLCFDCPTIANL